MALESWIHELDQGSEWRSRADCLTSLLGVVVCSQRPLRRTFSARFAVISESRPNQLLGDWNLTPDCEWLRFCHLRARFELNQPRLVALPSDARCAGHSSPPGVMSPRRLGAVREFGLTSEPLGQSELPLRSIAGWSCHGPNARVCR
jgi:hypothetical protein